MSAKEPSAGAVEALNDTQMKFLASMMKNSKAKPDVDWDVVASECGGITAKAARERYRLMAIKFGWNGTNKAGEGSAATTTPKKPAGVKKRTGRVGDSGKKPAAKGRGKKAAVAEEEADEEEDPENGNRVAKNEGEDSADEV